MWVGREFEYREIAAAQRCGVPRRMRFPSCEAPITQPSRGDLRIVQIGVLNRRTGARRLRDERGVMGIVKGM